MSDLMPLQVSKLAKLFSLSSCYVLSFSNKSMAEFFVEMGNDIFA